MIDTLKTNEDVARALETWREFGVEAQSYVLVTLHRPSLVDVPELLSRTIAALDDVADDACRSSFQSTRARGRTSWSTSGASC